MKKGLILLLLNSISILVKAQNTGIGIATPLTKLHIYTGASGINPYSQFSPLAVESNSHTYINILSPAANETGILFGSGSAVNGVIMYNNTSNLNGFQFRTNGNQTRMVIDNVGNVGIGTSSPNAPLTFPPFLGKKITLYPGVSGDVGFAVQGNLLQIYSDNPNADIAMGYDQAGTFTERFRVRANGSLSVNGSLGGTGQVLQSNGGAANSWVNGTNALYNSSSMVTSTGALTISQANGIIPIPGLTQSFTLSGNAKVMVSFTLPMSTFFCSFCVASNVRIYIRSNGSSVGVFNTTVANGGLGLISGSTLLSLGSGSYTLDIAANVIAGPDCFFYANDGSFGTCNMILQVIRQ
jgi:hypothetical protein